jgi:hypothetical protein
MLKYGSFFIVRPYYKFFAAPNFSRITATAGLWSWAAVSLFFASQVMFYRVSRKNPGYIKANTKRLDPKVEKFYHCCSKTIFLHIHFKEILCTSICRIVLCHFKEYLTHATVCSRYHYTMLCFNWWKLAVHLFFSHLFVTATNCSEHVGR